MILISKAKSENKDFRYEIQLLRIIAMGMIIILHISQKFIVNEDATLRLAVSILNNICAISVNIYALISGYVGVSRNIKLNRIIDLWIQCAFYSFIFALMQRAEKNIVLSFFPVSGRAFWYFSAYFCLFFLIPFINKAILALDKEKLFILLSVLISLFSILSTFSVELFGDTFLMGEGHSVWWIIILYIAGAYIKLYQKFIANKIRVALLISGILICNVNTLLEFKGVLTAGASYYNNPLTFAASIMVFLFFINIRINKFKRIIDFFARLSFGVYLVHCSVLSPIIVAAIEIYKKKIYEFVTPKWYIAIISIIIFAILIFICSALIDYIRLLAFKAVRLNILINKLSLLIEKNSRKLLRKFVD